MEKQEVSLFSFNHFGFMNTNGIDVTSILVFSCNRGINSFSLTLSISGNAVPCLIFEHEFIFHLLNSIQKRPKNEYA